MFYVEQLDQKEFVRVAGPFKTVEEACIEMRRLEREELMRNLRVIEAPVGDSRVYVCARGLAG